MMTSIFAAYSLALTTALVSPKREFTTCVRPSPHDLNRYVKSASRIFSGRLVSISPTTEVIPALGPGPATVYKFLPDKVWRGQRNDTIYLKGVPQYDDLSVLVPGKKYLFLLGSSAYISQCDPIAEDFSSFAQELDRLFKKKRFRNSSVAE